MFGGNGEEWDDGSHKCVRKIIVVHSDVCIYSIRVDYDDGPGERHGGEGTGQTKERPVELYRHGDFLKRVEGYFGPVDDSGNDVIRSLKFTSKKTTYGPYGQETGTRFVSPEGGGKILGFKGKSDNNRLNAIGFHLSEPSMGKKAIGRFQP